MTIKLRELMLLRHAKSEWKDAVPDINRPLSDRGKKNALKMGSWLKEHALEPDLILVSPATRAQQTLRRICHDFSANSITLDALYLADLQTLLHILSEAPQAERIMIIGHNPGLEHLFEYLNHDALSQTSSTEAITLFPTTSLAHFILPESWKLLEKGDGKLIQFIRPKHINQH